MRLFLDPGSQACLWRESTRPEEAGLDYAIDHHALGLSRNLQAALDALIALADLRIDWNDPASPGPHWGAELAARAEALQRGVRPALERELRVIGHRLAPPAAGEA